MSAQILELDQFEVAFSVPASSRDEALRRFSTLLLDETHMRRYGSNGVVSRAQNVFGEFFAVKRLRTGHEETPLPEIPPSRASSGALAAFRNEYESLLAVSNVRGFPRLYGYGMVGNDPLIVMEWIEGVSLADAFLQMKSRNAHRSIDPETVFAIGAELFGILARLDALSARPVHRDISPANVMVRTARCSLEDQIEQGAFDLCLVDFGSTTLIDEQNPAFTATTNILRHATPEYAPPEMLADTLPNVIELRRSPAIDVYAASSILYEALTGCTPFRVSEHPGEVPYLVKTQNAIEPLNAVLFTSGQDGPDGQDRIGCLQRACGAIMRGLDADQEKRPSAAAMRDAMLVSGNVQAASPVQSADGETPAFAHPAYGSAPVSRPLLTREGRNRAASVRKASFEHADDPGQDDNSRDSKRPSLSRRGFLAAVGCAALVVVGGGAYAMLSDAGRDSGEPETEDAGSDEVQAAADAPSNAAQATAVYEGGSLYSAKDPETMLWGYLNAQRQWVIAPTFQTVPGLFVGGLALAKDQLSTLFGYINERGEWALKPLYPKANMFGEGKAFVQSPSGSGTSLGGWIDTNGDWAIEPAFFGGGVFKQGLATCRTGSDNASRWGYVDETGAIVISEQFMDAGSFSDDGLALAAAHVGQYGWIDKQGEWVIEPQYGKAASFSEGLAGFMDPFSELWGYLDKGGSQVIAPVFADARLFKTGMAACQDAESKLWGFIDPRGEWVIEPKFEHAGDFVHGLAPAQDAQTKKFGYIDDTGYWVIPPQYLDVNLNVME